MRPTHTLPLVAFLLLASTGDAGALRAPGDPYDLADWYDSWGPARTEVLPHNIPTDQGVVAVEQPIAFIGIYYDLGLKRHDGNEVRTGTPFGDVAVVLRQDYYTPTLVVGTVVEDGNGQHTTEHALLV